MRSDPMTTMAEVVGCFAKGRSRNSNQTASAPPTGNSPSPLLGSYGSVSLSFFPCATATHTGAGGGAGPTLRHVYTVGPLLSWRTAPPSDLGPKREQV